MLVLDTHILVWWVSGDKTLSKRALKALQECRKEEGGEILISSISAWEIAMLIHKGRLVLTMPVETWLGHVARIEGLRFVPVDTSICLLSTSLPGDFHKDPADRMIVATARKYGAPLLTSDERIIRYPHVTTIS